MPDTTAVPEGKQQQIFDFLDALRESGRINMFGAPAVIRKHFDLTKQQSFDVFKAWTEQFGK